MKSFEEWIKNNKIIFVLIILVLLFILVALPILGYLEIWYFKDILLVTKDSFNLIYLLSSSLLIVGLYFTYRQLISAQTEIMQSSTRQANQASLKYLKLFANEIIPLIDAYNKELALKGLTEAKDIKIDLKQYNYTMDLLNLPVKEQTEILNWVLNRKDAVPNKGPIYIFNQLEYFSAAVINGVANEDVLFFPLHNSFLKFINNDILLLCSLRHYGTPFKHTLELYKIWTEKVNDFDKSLQIQELESKIKDIKSSLPQEPTQGIDYIGKK